MSPIGPKHQGEGLYGNAGPFLLEQIVQECVKYNLDLEFFSLVLGRTSG